MSRSYSKGKRDTNENDICVAILEHGGFYKKMPEVCGFDLLVVFPKTGVHIVEVKNPSYKWQLTDAEQDMKEDVEHYGGAYHVVETVEDCIKLGEQDGMGNTVTTTD